MNDSRMKYVVCALTVFALVGGAKLAAAAVPGDAVLNSCCDGLPQLFSALPQEKRYTRLVAKSAKLCSKASGFLNGDHAKRQRKANRKVRGVGKRLAKLSRRLVEDQQPTDAVSPASGGCSLSELRLNEDPEIAEALEAITAIPIPGPECGQSTVCIPNDGFTVTLVSIVDDPTEGVRSFTYEICGGNGTECPVPPKALSNFRVDLPEACIDSGQAARITYDPTVLTDCSIINNDELPPANQCGTPVEGDVIKCDVAAEEFGKAGECTTIVLAIASEPPVGVGLAAIGTKAGPDCQAAAIIGPSCESCEEPPAGDECLTRTPGFWGTHPAITGLFLPVTVCGVDLTTTDVAVQGSATEDLCVAPGKEAQGTAMSVQQLQLFRQLAAAKLNLAASAANVGNCNEAFQEVLDGCDVADLASLEAALCFAAGPEIGQCMGKLDAFNNSEDTLLPPPAPFDTPGPADPTQCREAINNGFINAR